MAIEDNFAAMLRAGDPLHAEIDRLPDEHLAAVHRLLQEVEVWHLMDSIGEAADAAREAGKMTGESIRESILEHRRGRPY